MALTVEVVTQEKRVFLNDAVIKVTVPSTTGQITILPRHTPIITQLDMGEMRIVCGECDEFLLAISGGILQMADDEVTILARTAEIAEEIDIQRAQEARDRAKELMESSLSSSEDEYASLQASLQRANLRLKVAQHRRTLPRRGTGPGEMNFGG